MKNLEMAAWCIGTLLISLVLLLALAKRRKQSLGKWPTSEKMLRPPGESLRLHLEKLDEKLLKFVGHFLIASLLAGIFFNMAYVFRNLSPWPVLIFAGMGIALIWASYRPLFSLQTQFLNNTLGFHGERIVGEQLNRLMLDGCEVFHDLQLADNWNIDHVIVSPYGVFAVETKGRRKPDVADGYKVIFTGSELQFPNGTDRSSLQQATDSARQLAGFLTKSTGEHVEVAPILTFPGWYVELKGKGNVHVLNPKLIGSVVLDSRRPLLDEARRKRICFQLEQKCRDVEM